MPVPSSDGPVKRDRVTKLVPDQEMTDVDMAQSLFVTSYLGRRNLVDGSFTWPDCVEEYPAGHDPSEIVVVVRPHVVVN